MVSMDVSSEVRMFEPSPFLTFSIERILAPDFGPNKFLDAAKLQTRGAGNRLSFGGVENDLCSLLRSIEGHSSEGREWSDDFSKLSSRGGAVSSPVSSCSSCEEEEDAKPLENRRTKRQLSFRDPEEIDLSRGADVKPFGGMVFCDPSLLTFRSSPHSEGESPFHLNPKRTRDELKSPFVARREECFGVTQRHADDSREATDSKQSLKLLKTFNAPSDKDWRATVRTGTILGNEPTKRRSFAAVEDAGPHHPSCTSPSPRKLLKSARKSSLRGDSAESIDVFGSESREATESEQSPKLSVEIVNRSVDGDRRKTCFVSSATRDLERPSFGDRDSVEGGPRTPPSCTHPPPVKLRAKPDSGRPDVRRRDSSDSDGPSVDPEVRREPLESPVDTLPRSPASSISGGEGVSPRKEQRPTSCAIRKTGGPEVLPEKEWPVWVYCSRYSARPSSGPRSRRQTKRSGGDRTTTSTAAAAAEEKRCRTAFSASQLSRLRAEFTSSAYLGEKRRLSLSRDLGLSEAQVKIWFQNRRAKLKKASGERNELAIRLMEHGLYDHSTSS